MFQMISTISLSPFLYLYLCKGELPVSGHPTMLLGAMPTMGNGSTSHIAPSNGVIEQEKNQDLLGVSLLL
jgi:hypothetical protein